MQDQSIPKNEVNRLKKLCIYEDRARKRGLRAIAGIDEAGRGPLAGPVVAAACILPEDLLLEGVDDSKKLNALKRFELYRKITEDSRICYGIGVVEAVIIDQINILRATFEAMLVAVAHLAKTPDYLLIDGNQLPSFKIPSEGIIKGDALSQSIAAASIIAKETRDQIMSHYHTLWPNYGFAKHKGYATEEHLAAIRLYGPSPIHRKSFEPIKSLVNRSTFFVQPDLFADESKA